MSLENSNIEIQNTSFLSRLRKRKRSRLSIYVVIGILTLGIFADFLANEKPLFAVYQSEVHFPVVKTYLVDLGISTWPKELRNANWKQLEYDMVLWPPIPYLPSNLDLGKGKLKSPFSMGGGPLWHDVHFLGTDDLGRDVLAGLIHGCRLAMLAGFLAMFIASLIGIFMGSAAGFYGDNRFKISKLELGVLMITIPIGFIYSTIVRRFALIDSLGTGLSSFAFEILLSLVVFLLFQIPIFVARKLSKKQNNISLPIDLIVGRIMEVFQNIPIIFLIVSLVAIAKPSIGLVMILIGLTSWTGIARFCRGEMLRIRTLSYMESARALGYSDFRQIIKHGLPNALGPIMVTISFGIAAAILTESTLSFLGLGVPPDTVSWGSMLSSARKLPAAWWLAIFPGMAIFLTVLCFNLIGEGIDLAIDPKKRLMK